MREFHCGENKTCQNGLQKTSYGQETLDKAFLILYICRSNYQWIKEKIKNNEKGVDKSNKTSIINKRRC